MEDELFIRQGLKLTTPWNKLGCIVVGEASNAVEGEKCILKTKPDIVITDIRMPKINGLDMIKNLEGKVDCEVIVISGYDEFEYAKEAVKLGVNGYLLKPIDDDELIDVISKTVEVVETKREYRHLLKRLEDLKPEFAFDRTSLQCKFKGNPKNNYLKGAFEYIKNNCTRDITLKDVADSLYISESYLSKLFRDNTEYTFVEVLTLNRMKQAINLLDKTDMKIYEISEILGYKDARYFSNLFKKFVGLTPMEYKSLG